MWPLTLLITNEKQNLVTSLQIWSTPLGKLSHNFYMGEKLAQTDHVGEM